MTHVERPEVLVLAHQILQLLLKIQPVDQSHKTRGHGLRHPSPPWPRPGVVMQRPWETCSCSLLCKKHLHHLDPPSLSPAGSSSNRHPQYYPHHNPSQHIAPILPGTGLYLSCLCLFFSSSIWEFRAEIRSLHSCSMVCFLGRGKVALSHIL